MRFSFIKGATFLASHYIGSRLQDDALGSGSEPVLTLTRTLWLLMQLVYCGLIKCVFIQWHSVVFQMVQRRSCWPGFFWHEITPFLLLQWLCHLLPHTHTDFHIHKMNWSHTVPPPVTHSFTQFRHLKSYAFTTRSHSKRFLMSKVPI